MNAFCELLWKDLMIELRMREIVIPLVSLLIIFSVAVGFGVQSVFADPETIARFFPVFFFLVFLFATTAALSRGFDGELSLRAIDGVLMTGVDPALIYLSKVTILGAINIGCGALLLLILSALLGAPLGTAAIGCLVLTALVGIGLTALSVLLTGVSAQSRLGAALLPLLLIPLALPLIAGGTELLAATIASQRLVTDSSWFVLLSVLDVVYLVLGLNLFQFVIRE